MMKMSIYFVITMFLSILLLLACDPVRTIQIEAKKKDTHILVYLKSTNSKHVGISAKTNPIEVSLHTNPQFRQHFSIGKWDGTSIKYLLVDQIDSIVILNRQQKQAYTTPICMQQYLISRRKTFSKHVIQIK